ncbi:hypothetical protein PWT90_07661 [Aphanocladium album]|nr:hypothetical protein PWT90_07661 [Aphanocladium album]
MHTLALLAGLAGTSLAAATTSDQDQQQRHKSVNQHSAQDVIAKLNLTANVEKGYFAQTFVDPVLVNGNRSASTLIYYLLEGKDGDSVWHRVDAAEVWHYYAGAPLTLSLSYNDGKPVEKHVLGQEIFDGQSPQVVIMENQWQSARSHGDWTLVGTTVAPAFTTDGYELAPPGWHPKGASCP